MLVFGFENPEAADFKLLWWAGMMAILAARAIDVIWWKKTQQIKHYDGKKATLRFVFGVNLTALMWCVYSLSVFQSSNNIELACNIIIVSSLAGGASTVLAAHRFTVIVYSFLLLAPFSFALLLSSQVYQSLLGALGLAFSLVMVFTARKAATFTKKALQFKNENEVLVHHMEEQVAQRTQKIYELSSLDPLTGLLNRRTFLNKLSQQIELSKSLNQSLALLFIDLDGFKKINDAIGHEMGDKILSRTGDRLKDFCGKDQISCRWGGDEFIMVFPNTGSTMAQLESKKIIASISKPHEFNDNRLLVSATVGISMFPQHSTEAALLIRLADAAMYYQKKQAPSRAFVFSEELDEQILREHQLKSGLAQALNKQELRLVFQPIVCSKTRQTLGFETLVRWQFGKESIPATEFIDIAEQYGMIQSIGAWVIQEACNIASSWDRSQTLVVSVNVSITQLQDENFLNIVDLAIQNSGLASEQLNIEITESVFASDRDLIFKQVAALQSRGIKVSIDDFGTGYSSLSIIQDLAVDIIKIDQYFVANLDTKGRTIIHAIITIANSLDYLVIAEGVESAAQAKTLSDLGVYCQQGYYYSKPIEVMT